MPSGTREPANHQYDLDDFYAAVKAGNFPAVSFLKAPAYQDGHAGYSDPLDEQAAIVKLRQLSASAGRSGRTRRSSSTWDDSDGWYDHAAPKSTSPSFDAADQRDGNGVCGTGTALPGVNGKPVNGRCGPGTRIPFLVISPWAKVNAVSHAPITPSLGRALHRGQLAARRSGSAAVRSTRAPARSWTCSTSDRAAVTRRF